MNVIYEFCKGAERIFPSTTNIVALKEGKTNLDLTKSEIYRTRSNRDGSSIFTMRMDVRPGTTIYDEIDFMRSIEMFYPDTFSWRFTGKHIEAIALAPIRKELLGVYGRFNGVNSFMRRLRKQLVRVIQYRRYSDAQPDLDIDYMVLSTGSIHHEAQLYVIDIKPSFNRIKILSNSCYGYVKDPTIKELDMKFWVKEMNPDYFKEMKPRKSKRFPIDGSVWEKYPRAIKNIAALPKKGNYNRFLLATYFLSVHNERDAKHQLDMVLSEDERNHINKGNCKDQWRTIVAKGYSAPSCKTLMECGFAETILDCEDGFEK